MISKFSSLYSEPVRNISEFNCSTGIQWIYHVLNDCVYDSRGVASEVFGLASIITWMIVSIPQMVKNCRDIKGVEGISFMLILMWTLGDTANLVGAYLTKQLPLQIYLAVYFVIADMLLFAQFLYYNLWWKKRFKGYEPISGSSSIDSSINGATPQAVLCISGVLMFGGHGLLSMMTSVNHGPGMSLQYLSKGHHSGRTLLATNLQYHLPIHVFESVEDTVGYAIGIVSSIFYTFSRLGQMWKNYKRKSTEGLSIAMFILAVLGNLTYGVSILVRSLDGTYVLRHLPWLIGSLGVIFLDTSLLVQFKVYGAKDDFDKLLEEPVTVSVQHGETYGDVQPDTRGSVNT